MLLSDLLQYLGAASGMLGALLLALNNSYSKFGYLAYLVSNVAWVAFAVLTQVQGLLVMQGFFFVTALIGLWKWFLGLSQWTSGIIKETRHVA